MTKTSALRDHRQFSPSLRNRAIGLDPQNDAIAILNRTGFVIEKTLIPYLAHQTGAPFLGIAPWQPPMLIRAALQLACLFLSQAVLKRSNFA